MTSGSFVNLSVCLYRSLIVYTFHRLVTLSEYLDIPPKCPDNPFGSELNMWHSIGKGPIWSFLETVILRKVGEMINEKNDFPYFGVLGHQKHPYVGRILNKWIQGSIYAQFYMAMKGPLSWLLLQLCTMSAKRHTKTSFPLSEGMAY